MTRTADLLSDFSSLPAEVILQLYEALPAIDRLSLAQCTKFHANLALRGGFLEVHAFDKPIFSSFSDLATACALHETMTHMSVSNGYKIDKSVEPACSWCGWTGRLGKLHWFRHLALELNRLGDPVTKGILQAVSFEVLKEGVQAAAIWYRDMKIGYVEDVGLEDLDVENVDRERVDAERQLVEGIVADILQMSVSEVVEDDDFSGF